MNTKRQQRERMRKAKVERHYTAYHYLYLLLRALGLKDLAYKVVFKQRVPRAHYYVGGHLVRTEWIVPNEIKVVRISKHAVRADDIKDPDPVPTKLQ